MSVWGYRCPVCGKGFGRGIRPSTQPSAQLKAMLKPEVKLFWRHVVWQHPEYLESWFSDRKKRWCYIRRKITRAVETNTNYRQIFNLDLDNHLRIRCFFWKPSIVRLISDKYREITLRLVNEVLTPEGIEDIVDMLGNYWFKHAGIEPEPLDRVVAFARY